MWYNNQTKSLTLPPGLSSSAAQTPAMVVCSAAIVEYDRWDLFLLVERVERVRQRARGWGCLEVLSACNLYNLWAKRVSLELNWTRGMAWHALCYSSSHQLRPVQLRASPIWFVLIWFASDHHRGKSHNSPFEPESFKDQDQDRWGSRVLFVKQSEFTGLCCSVVDRNYLVRIHVSLCVLYFENLGSRSELS